MITNVPVIRWKFTRRVNVTLANCRALHLDWTSASVVWCIHVGMLGASPLELKVVVDDETWIWFSTWS